LGDEDLDGELDAEYNCFWGGSDSNVCPFIVAYERFELTAATAILAFLEMLSLEVGRGATVTLSV
jgi:hypothetical protein